MPIKEKAYWQDTVITPAASPQHDLPARVDVAVIGAGIPGLSAALQLAKRGARTAVLEAQAVGWGASSRNGGMALTGLKVDASVVVKRYGFDLARQLFDDSIASVDTVERLIREELIDCDFSRSGHLLVASKPAHYTALQGEVEWYARHFDHRSRLVPKDELRSELGSDAYHGGLVDDTSAGLNPARYVIGLARAAEKYAAVLCPKTTLLKIEKSTQGYRLKTSRGEMSAAQVLVTTGGYSGAAFPYLQRRIIPIGSYIIATQPLPESLANELIPHRRMVFDTRHFLNYYRLSADQRMVFGGRAAFFPETPSTILQSASILRREMVHVFPQLKDASVEYAWGGTLDFPFDLMPHAGQVDGIHFALGFAGHGVALGTHLGMRIANAILDGNVSELPYSTYDFPTAPLGLYSGKAWFLPLIGLWHRWLDVIQ